MRTWPGRRFNGIYSLPSSGLHSILHAMPLKGRQRTEHQKAHTAAMGKQSRSSKSPVKAKVIDPAGSRRLSEERRKFKKELENVRKSELNARRRERRAQEKLKEEEEELQVRVEGWFSHYRDRFRDQLSNANPRSFPRRGPLPASAGQILEVMFGRGTGPYLEQHLVCLGCGTLSRAERQFSLLPMSFGHDRRTPISLHAAWSTFTSHARTDVARREVICSRCQGPNKVQTLEMPDSPWIWFERDQHSPVSPSLALTFDFPPQRLSYGLRAIIYAGENHFSLRFRAQSGDWWKHDGQVASGVPQSDNVQSEAQLLKNGTHFAHLLIYRRDSQ
jgi:hypothetical protein